MLNIFEKKKLILTEWDNSPESKKNFKKAIKKLKAENIPFIIVEKRLINELGKKVYISYSVSMDTVLLITVILALLNADKILKLLGQTQQFELMMRVCRTPSDALYGIVKIGAMYSWRVVGSVQQAASLCVTAMF